MSPLLPMMIGLFTHMILVLLSLFLLHTLERCFCVALSPAIVSFPRSMLFLSMNTASISMGDDIDADDLLVGTNLPKKPAFDAAVLGRYACKKFQRFDGQPSSHPTASPPDPKVVAAAAFCLDLARQSPSAFNIQPTKVVLVYSSEQKTALSRYCLGPNGARVRDSDCTAVFLADRQILRSLPRFRKFLVETNPQRKTNRFRLLQTQFYIAIFSSGYPLPRILAAPFSFLVRTGVALVNFLSGPLWQLPSLSNAETWAAKNAMLMAMTYMLACSSRSLATSPMEGINGRGIRRVLNIPCRYSIPLIVSTGVAQTDDKAARVRHASMTRYPMDEVVFGDTYGHKVNITAVR